MAECDRSIGGGAFAQGGEDGNCGQLALLPRQQVALEDVAEQVFFQVPINDGDKGGIARLGRIGGDAAQLLEQLRAAGVLVAAVADRRRVAPHSVGDAPRFALVEHLHEGLQTTQAAGKAAVGIGVHHHFLGLVHSHPAVQPAGKGGPQVLQGACGGGGGDGYDALLAEAQRVGLRGPQGGAQGG